MAKAIVMNPPAVLEQRESDCRIPSQGYAEISLFASLKTKPNFDKFPGTLVVRRFRKGETICRQGESGWTAFYLLTRKDVQALNIAGPGDDPPEDSEPENGKRPVVSVYLTLGRPGPRGVRGRLRRLAERLLGRSSAVPGRRPLFIPIDAPTNLSYFDRQAYLNEGDLFGEQSCLYGTPRSATIVAERDCYIVEMLRNILDQVQADAAYKKKMDEVYKQRILKDHLRNLSIFSDLTDEQLASIRDHVDLIRYKDGQLIYDEHDLSDGMYVIRSGLVKIMKNVSSLLVPGDAIDWPRIMTFVRGQDPQPSPAVQYLRQLLPEPLRSTEEDGLKISPARQEEVLAALNEVIKSPGLARAAQVKALTSPALTELGQRLPSKSDDWSELDRRRYNRLLLQAACPGALRNRQLPTGPETVLAYLSRGDLIGEMGVLLKQPRTATCVAYIHPRPEQVGQPAERWRREAEHVELVRIPDRVFADIIATAPVIRKKIEQLIATRKAQGEQRTSQPHWDENAAMLLSGRAEELGLIQGQKLMLIDLDRCTRCDECVQACVNTHTDGRSRLFLDGPRFGKYLIPTTCRSCLDPVCMIGCPVGSIHRGDNRQIVIEDWCIGCELCSRNCPYGSIQMHDTGIISGSTYGWAYAPEKHAGRGWQQRRFSTAHWLQGKTPFLPTRELSENVAARWPEADTQDALCFRYEFRLEGQLARPTAQLRLEVASPDEQAAVWLNGQELARSPEKPRGGMVKREYVLSGKPLRAGRNVVAIRVLPPPPAPERKVSLLEVRLDEIHLPSMPGPLAESVEISQKAVTEVAVVCDLCSSQLGQRPACVTACPHDAAMRIDARSSFPLR